MSERISDSPGATGTKRLWALVVVLVTAASAVALLLACARLLQRSLEERPRPETTYAPPVSPPVLQLGGPSTVPRQRPELRGVWIHIYGPQDWEEIARRLRAANFNAIFLRVARGGEALYPSEVLPQESWAVSGRDELAAAIEAAHRFGLELHAWKVCYHLGSLVRDAREKGGPWARFLDRLRGEGRLVTNSRGQTANWLNPADPRNLRLELAVAEEVLSRYDVDGYHLDYIRYPDDPGFDYDFGPVSRRLFEAGRGTPVGNWPEDVLAGPLAVEYLRWEQDVITETVWRIRELRDRVRPDALLSAAVWRNIGLHQGTVKQHWPRWAELRLIDFLVLMNYEQTADGFLEQLDDALARTRGFVPLVAGIGSWRLKPAEVLRQVEISRQLGADGFVLFSYNADGIDEQLQLLAREATRFPVPQGCRGPVVDIEPLSGVFQAWAGHPVYPARIPLQLVVRSRVARALKAEIRARTLDGEYVFHASDLGLTPANEARLTLPVVNRPVQVEVYATGEGGKTLACRSGWYVPVSDVEYRQLVATTRPPSPFVRPSVGLLIPARDSETLYPLFRKMAGARLVPVYSLDFSHLEPLDVLIIPPLVDLGLLTTEAANAVRVWVSSGGTCVLIDDAVGRGPHIGLFPEVGRGLRRTQSEHLIWTESGAEFPHECQGHVVLAPAQHASVYVSEPGDGGPVVVGGSFGRGHVFLLGLSTRELAQGGVAGPLAEFLREVLGVARPAGSSTGRSRSLN